MKDRTAGMELEAHCRAEQVEAEAAERVKKMREQVEHWLGRVQNEYDRLRTSMDATLSHAGGELGAGYGRMLARPLGGAGAAGRGAGRPRRDLPDGTGSPAAPPAASGRSIRSGRGLLRAAVLRNGNAGQSERRGTV